jgi:endonuclease/exonuclease/phosphatase (EEP) superfamily protein YafD
MIFKLLFLASLLTLLPSYLFPGFLAFLIEVNSSFPTAHCAIGIVSLIYFLFRKKSAWIFLSFLSIAIQSNAIFWPLYSTGNKVEGKEISLFYANVFVHNKDYQSLKNFIENSNPDIVCLTEVSQKWLDELRLGDSYKFHYLMPGISADGNAIYSKYKLSNRQRISDDGYFAALSTEVLLEEDKFLFINLIHAPPPQVDFSGEGRLSFFKLLASKIQPNLDRSIVLGDFNVSSSTRFFWKIVSLFGMKVATNGIVDYPTWRPLEFPVLFSPIDHVLIGSKIESLTLEIGADVGSDHLPLLIKFRVQN